MASNLPQPPTGNDPFLNRWLYLLWDKVRRSLSPEEIPDLDWSKITTGKPTTLSGYGITDGYTWISQAVSGTATSISIPAGVKEMVILFDDITTSSADSVSKAVRIRLGTSGGIDSGSTYRNGNYTYMDFFYGLMLNAHATSCQALMFLYRVGGTGNYWFGSLDASNALGSLSKTLSAELTAIQVSYLDAGYTFTGGYIRVGYR